MGINMFLVQPHSPEDEDMREKIASFITGKLNGFILMATSAGGILAAFDESLIEHVRACEAVAFASGVSLDPNAPGAAALQAKFAENISLQLAERPDAGRVFGNIEDSNRLPPGYKPLVWRSPHFAADRV
jgi:hypothetical protein